MVLGHIKERSKSLSAIFSICWLQVSNPQKSCGVRKKELDAQGMIHKLNFKEYSLQRSLFSNLVRLRGLLIFFAMFETI